MIQCRGTQRVKFHFRHLPNFPTGINKVHLDLNIRGGKFTKGLWSMPDKSGEPHLFQDLLQVSVSLLRSKLQFHDEPVHLIDNENRPDVL